MKIMQENISLKPTLSISLLSSGRKETLWKCLDSLQPIRDAISSELIIVDTGCDEETHNKMKEYTNQIIKFTWCNDFSKARNVGLKEAKGEWFLFIDDDEWFTDVTELIEFFQSGEYKEYGYANYIQRNYTHSSGKSYQDAWVSRLIRLDKDTRFVSSIHEHFYPVKGKWKLLHSLVDHYGYIFKNDREMYAHSKRNITLLTDMIKKEKDNPRWWVHLAQEYKGIGEYHKLEELCQQGIKNFAQINRASINNERGTFYVGLVIIDLKREDYEKAKIDVEKYLADKRNTQVCQARLYGLAAQTCYLLKEYEECQNYCRKYLEIYDQIHEDEMLILRDGGFFVRDAFKDEIRNNVYSFYIGSTLKQGNSKVLKEYFYRFAWTESQLCFYGSLPIDIVEGIANLPYEQEFVEIAETLIKRKGIEKRVVQELRNREAEGRESKEFLQLCHIFSQIEEPQHHYILYLKLLDAECRGDEETINEVCKKLFKKVVNLWDLKNRVFTIALKHNLDLDPVFREIKFENWKKGVDILFKNPEKEKIALRKEFLQKIQKTDNIRYEYFWMKESEANLRMLEEDYDSVYIGLKDFSYRYLAFYQKFYREVAFQGDMELLPPDCRLAVRLSKVFEEEEAGEIRAMTAAIKECFGVYSPLDSVLKSFTEGKKREVKEAGEARKELLNLGEQIKIQLYSFIARGMYTEAYPILQQLKQLLPSEPEVLALEDTIKEGLS